MEPNSLYVIELPGSNLTVQTNVRKIFGEEALVLNLESVTSKSGYRCRHLNLWLMSLFSLLECSTYMSGYRLQFNFSFIVQKQYTYRTFYHRYLFTRPYWVLLLHRMNGFSLTLSGSLVGPLKFARVLLIDSSKLSLECKCAQD